MKRGRPVIDLTGQRFGKLTVIERNGTYTNGTALWACKCDCGGSRTVASEALMKSRTRSCGCIRRQTFINNLAAGRARANARKAASRVYATGPDLAPLLARARAALAREWADA